MDLKYSYSDQGTGYGYRYDNFFHFTSSYALDQRYIREEVVVGYGYPIPSIPNTADITGWLKGALFIARPLNADVRARNVWQRHSRDTANQP